MGSELPKQMLDLCGKPVLRWTVELFLDQPFEVRVIISINDSIKDIWLEYCRKNNFVFPSILISGGITRFHSVRKAMKYLPDGALAAVHDGVRPLLRKEDVAALFEEAEQYPAVVPVIPVGSGLHAEGRGGRQFRYCGQERFQTGADASDFPYRGAEKGICSRLFPRVYG